MNIITNQDGFQLKENEGRTKLESFISQSKTFSNWQPTTGKYDPVDGYFNWRDKKAVVEIKTRDVKYMNYSIHLMELDKYMNVAKARVDNKYDKALYACFFGDTLYVYDLKYVSTSTCKITEGYSPCTSVEDNGYRYKKYFEIPTTFAQVFKLDNGKWKSIKKGQ